MSSSTKEALGAALKKMMAVKPIDKITVKDLVEICGVNRQTFYYHFDDVYDLLEWVFEEDANRVLPHKVVFEHWREDVMIFMKYLEENGSFTLNVYNSNSRVYMLRYLEEKMAACIRSFAVIVSEGMNIDRQEKQVKFDYALIAFMCYFISDTFWAMMIAGVLPKTFYTVIPVNFLNYLFMSSIT